MQVTLKIIQAIVAEKLATMHEPAYATEAEVRDIDAEAAGKLDEMERLGLIRMGRTINSRWIVISD